MTINETGILLQNKISRRSTYYTRTLSRTILAITFFWQAPRLAIIKLITITSALGALLPSSVTVGPHEIEEDTSPGVKQQKIYGDNAGEEELKDPPPLDAEDGQTRFFLVHRSSLGEKTCTACVKTAASVYRLRRNNTGFENR